MFTFLRSLSYKIILLEQVPLIIFCVIIAEFFYKFRSFTLETIAFFATWFVLDLVIQLVKRVVNPKAEVRGQGSGVGR
jgi:hypothetical protein